MTRRRTILIIEDHPLVLQILAEFLEDAGMSILTAENGREGVEIARHHCPDVIITNFKMPELDGLGVLKHLRGDPRTAAIPVLFITSSQNLSLRERSLRDGADAFLRKDFDPGELLNAVYELLPDGEAKAQRSTQ